MRVRAQVRRIAGVPNKTEQRRANELEVLKRAGEIQWWAFEGVTLKIAADCRYTPDFLVLSDDGRLIAEEVKGWARDDALVKLRVAATTFPWIEFRMFTPRKGGAWEIKTFNAMEPARQ